MVGVSGGADSVFLLHALKYAQCNGLDFSLTAAHFNHCIRGEAADADERFVDELCRNLDVELVTERLDVPHYAQENGLTLEQAGRILRYEFFRRQNCDLIAVAHHMDDQAESVLMHIIRGSGLRGLCGMPYKSNDIIRPLLNTRRIDIERFLNEHAIPYRTDETNLIPDGFRNKLRLDVIPYITREINPHFTKNLCDMAHRLSADEEYLEGIAAKALSLARLDKASYDKTALFMLESPIRYRAITMALKDIGVTADIEAKHIDMIVDLLRGGTGRGIDIPHARVETEYDAVVFLPAFDTVIDTTQHKSIELVIGQTVDFSGYRFKSELIRGVHIVRDPFVSCMDIRYVPDSLVIRTRRHGDRFHPLGAPGEKKLKDYFIDKKIPRSCRNVPLICDAVSNDVLYVTGQTTSQKVRVSDTTEMTLCITVTLI